VIAEGTSVPFALWLLPIFTTAGGVLGIAAVRMTAARNAAVPTAESQIATPPGEASH
jgi:hypothetical protein